MKDSSVWICSRKSLLPGNTLKCDYRRLDEGRRGRGRSHCDGHRRSRVTFKDKRAEFGSVSPNEQMIGHESMFVLNSQAGQLSVWRPAENDVAGIGGGL